MTFEITIPLYVLTYGPIVLFAVAAMGFTHSLRRYLQVRKRNKIILERLESIEFNLTRHYPSKATR